MTSVKKVVYFLIFSNFFFFSGEKPMTLLIHQWFKKMYFKNITGLKFKKKSFEKSNIAEDRTK